MSREGHWEGDSAAALINPLLRSHLYFLLSCAAMAIAFEKPLVYQKANDLADHVSALTEHFPRGYGYLTDQLNRVASSIANNIAEGNGLFTAPDRRQFFGSPVDRSMNVSRNLSWPRGDP